MGTRPLARPGLAKQIMLYLSTIFHDDSQVPNRKRTARIGNPLEGATTCSNGEAACSFFGGGNDKSCL
jgi:hypothetical protein